MRKEIFVLPIPSSWLNSPKFHEGHRRKSEIICEYESDTGRCVRLSLFFENTYAVKITYHLANDARIIPMAYDKVVDLGDTDWLTGIKSTIASNQGSYVDLRHFAIFFDDGPLYEFVCKSFYAEESPAKV